MVSPAGHQLRASVSSAFAWRNAAGTLDGSTASATLEYERPTGAVWTLAVTRQEDDLLVAFTPVPDASVPVGRYVAGFAELKLKPSTGPRAVVGGSVRAGESTTPAVLGSALARVRVSRPISGSRRISTRPPGIRGSGRAGLSTLARLRVLARPAPRLSLSAVLQANGSADLATANLRLRYSCGRGTTFGSSTITIRTSTRDR